MFDSLNHFRSVVAHEFFVAPADRDYYLARQAKFSGCHEQFYWQALQAIEKYMKAGLLLNGRCVRPLGHDLSEIYRTHCEVFGDLAFADFMRPDDIRPDIWRDESVEQYIQRIHAQGHPDSRYGLTSWFVKGDDLFKLDQVAFEARRRSIGLSWIIGQDWDERDLAEHCGRTYADVIRDLSQVQPRKIEVPEGKVLLASNDANDVWFGWNFSFLRDDLDLTLTTPTHLSAQLGPGQNSLLSLLLDALADASPDDCILRHGVRWLLDNVVIHPDAKNALKAHL